MPAILSAMRVLHLIDAASPQACPTTLALLSEAIGRLIDVEQHVVLLGGSALRDAAKAAGIRDATLIGTPFGRAMHGAFALRRQLAAMPRFDLVHAWSIGSLTLAALLLRDTPRVITLAMPPTPRQLHWLRMIVEHSPDAGSGGATVLATSATIRREAMSRGVPEKSVHVLRPGIDMGRVSKVNRSAVRESWGLPVGTPADRTSHVIALLADPPHAHDALFSTLVCSIAGEIYGPRQPHSPHRVHVLAHPDLHRRINAQAMTREMGVAHMVICDERLARPWEVLPACDLALATGANAGGLSMLWAMASNIPIVAEAGYAVSEIVQANTSALVAKPGVHKQLALRINQIIDEPHTAWKLRDAARHECYSFFSRQRYCTQLKTVYEQVMAGQPVDIPPLESTGGLRFSGHS